MSLATFRVEYRQIFSDGREVLAYEFDEAETEIEAMEQVVRRREIGPIQIKIESCGKVEA